MGRVSSGEHHQYIPATLVGYVQIELQSGATPPMGNPMTHGIVIRGGEIIDSIRADLIPGGLAIEVGVITAVGDVDADGV